MTREVFSKIQCCASTAPGLEKFLAEEIKSHVKYVTDLAASDPGYVRFTYSGTFEDLHKLKSAYAIYRIFYFAVPRPKAMLGHDLLQQIATNIKSILAIPGNERAQKLHIEAAGADSPVMQRLGQELAASLGLNFDSNQGDVVMRMLRDAKRTGWEIHLRTTIRPLVTRKWRAADFEGALNASVAYVMNLLTSPMAEDRYLNLCAGSGTLLIERAQMLGASVLQGVEIAPAALAAAEKNIATADLSDNISLIRADARSMPLKDESYDVITADLPFGMNIGRGEDLYELYYSIMLECARVGTNNCRIVLLTTQTRLLQEVIEGAGIFTINAQYKIDLRGVKPTIFVLTK